MKILFWKKGSNKNAFRLRYIETVKNEFPHLHCEIYGEYGVKIIGSENHEVIDVWLERGYEEFSKSPETVVDILSRWIGMLRDTINADGNIDLESIVPVVKRKDWPDQQRAVLTAMHGSDVKVEYWTEAFNSELLIVFAQWHSGFSYPTPEDFLKTGKPFEELRAIAMKNLDRRCTGRMVNGSDGLYLVSIGGNIDASLILREDIWKDARLRISGECIVGVPDRSTFIVCDSNDLMQVYRAATSTIDLWRTEQYPISPKLFIRRNDKFQELENMEDDDDHPIPKLDVIDVYAIKKEGGARLHMVIDSPLHADIRSTYRLARKLDFYIQFMLSDDIVRECGRPTPEKTEISVRLHPDSDSFMAGLLNDLAEMVTKKGATLIISQEG